MEESNRFIRGYDDILSEDNEISTDHRLSPSPNNPRTVPTIITLSIFAIIIGTIITLIVVRQHTHQIYYSKTLHHHHRRPKPSKQLLSLIPAVCAVTQPPESCLADVNPTMIFNITLCMAKNEIMNISLMSKTVILDVGGLSTSLALGECVSLLDDAVSQLSRAGESLVGKIERNVADLMTWISAAKADLEMCVDGLEEVGSTVGDMVKVRVQRASVYVCDSLAILGNMEGLLDWFGLQML